MIFFFQTLGGAIFVSVGQNVFLDKLIARIAATVPRSSINPANIASTGATELRHIVPPQVLPAVLQAYNWALIKGPMVVSVILACLTVLGAVGMEWKSLKKKGHDKKKKKEEEEDAVAEGAEAVAAAAGAVEPVEDVENDSGVDGEKTNAPMGRAGESSLVELREKGEDKI
jgi:hypothetical protein